MAIFKMSYNEICIGNIKMSKIKILIWMDLYVNNQTQRRPSDDGCNLSDWEPVVKALV